MESFYSDAFAGFDEDDVFYEGLLDDYIEAPEGFDVTIPTTARAVVDEAVDNANPSDIIVKYSPRGNSKKAEEDADLVRRWVHGLWTHWRSANGDVDPVRDFLKNLFKSGKACFKIAPDQFLWPEMDPDAEEELTASGELMEAVAEIERMRAQNTPMFVRSIPPKCIMEDPTITPRKLWVIERYESSVEDIRNLYAQFYEPLQENYYQVGYPVHEVWTATYVDKTGRIQRGRHWVFVNWECVIDGDLNPYGDLPYVIKHSGYGRESYEGKPELKAVGFFTRATKSVFLAEARRLSQFDAIMSQVAYPVAFLEDTVAEESISFSPGSVNFVPQAVLQNIDKVWLQAPIPDAEYLASLNIISSQIERGTVQRALRGAGVPGTDSAAQLGMITDQARMKVTSAVEGTSAAMAEISSKALRLVEDTFKSPVSVFVAEATTPKYTLRPANISGHHTLSIEFQPNEEAIKQKRLILANDARSKGGFSPYDAYVYAGYDNPLELIARSQAYELMQDPLIKRALAKDVLADWGYDADQLAMEAQEEDGRMQMQLKHFMDQLQMGTMRGVGDPMSPNGVPPPGPQGGPPPEMQGGMPPEMMQQPPQMPPPEMMMPPPPPPPEQASGTEGQGLPVAAGNPAAMQAGPVQGLLHDISALRAG